MNEIHESLERHHYQLLLAFREMGHLGRAAEALSISPSAASHRLREAERRLGVELAERVGRNLRLTRAGAHLADAAAASEATLRAGEEASRWLGSTARPTVRVALDFYDRAPWFYRYGGFGRLPFRVDIIRVAYGGSADAVARRVVDVGVRIVSMRSNEADLLATDELAAAVPIDHPAAGRGSLLPGEIASLPYLTAGGRPEPGFEFEEFLQPAGVYPEDIVMIESVSVILQLVEIGRGITILPRKGLTPTPDGLAVVPLHDVTVPVYWEAVTRPDRDENTETLLEAITDPTTTVLSATNRSDRARRRR